MESHAKLLGHPAHQMLVTFPIGALGFSVASDVIHSYVGKRRFADAATLALSFGLLSAAVAIPFGAVDLFAIPQGTSARRVGTWHAVGNLAVLGLFGVSRLLRRRRTPPNAAKWLSGAGFVLSGVTAWLGGELVDKYGIGVEAQLGDRVSEDQLESAAPSASPTSDDAPTLPGIYASVPQQRLNSTR